MISLPEFEFEFAVVAEPDFGAAEWAQLVHRIEDLGYDALMVTDHLQLRLAAVPALASAAALSNRIRLGSYVLNSDLRNPTLLARDMATVHTLSAGRAIVGLGAGWMRADYERTGTTLDTGPTRFDRLRAAMPAVRKVLDAAAAADATAAPPLLLGGARRRMLEFAGREADIISVLPPLGPDGPDGYAPMLADRVDAQLAWVRAGAAGRTKPPILNHLLWGCYVTPDPAAVSSALARALGCAPHHVPDLVPYLVGTVEQIAEILLARRARWGFSLITVPASQAADFVPVMRALRR